MLFLQLGTHSSVIHFVLRNIPVSNLELNQGTVATEVESKTEKITGDEQSQKTEWKPRCLSQVRTLNGRYISKIKSSLYWRYYAEVCNEWRGPYQ